MKDGYVCTFWNELVKPGGSTCEDDVQSDASARASSLLVEIIEQKKTAKSQQTNQ